MVPQPPSFVHHPLALLSASFALGILAGRYLHLPLNLHLACCAFLSAATLYCHVKRRERTSALLLMLAFLSAGAALAQIEKNGIGTNRVRRLYDDAVIGSGSPVEVTGVVTSAPEPAPDGFYLTLKVERLRFREEEREATGRVMLFAPVRDQRVQAMYDELELRYGARIRVMAALSRTENYRNPGVSPYTEYLERRDLDATASVKHPLLIERLDDEPVFLPLAWVYEWRRRLMSLIEERFSQETAGILKASLLGNRYQLSRATAERFRQGGTFHVLVISGLHISFIGGLVLFLMKRVTARRAWQFAVPVIFLWAYTLAVGAEIAVVRAALMFMLVALAPLVHRRARSLNALGAAIIILLIARPSDLFDPAFHLTFLSVLAIISVGWPLLQKFRGIGEWRPTRETPYPPACPPFWRALAEILFWSERAWRREIARSDHRYRLFKSPSASRLERLHVQRPLRYAAGAVVISASVQLMLLPLFVLYFHRLPLASILLNIFVGALMALASLVALAALLVSGLSVWLAAPLIHLAEGLNWLMVHSVDPFAEAGLASVRLPEYAGSGAVVYALYYLPLAVLAVRLARWNPLASPSATEERRRISRLTITRAAATAHLLLASVIIAHPFSEGTTGGRLRVDFLDVGQGDASLITMPDGTTLLIDAGGRPRFDYKRKPSGEEQTEEGFERDTRSIGEAVVSEYLWWRGLSRVDYIMATHADADHIDGLHDVARNFYVRSALVGRTPATDSEFIRFAKTARESGVPLQVIGRGDLLRFGAVEVEVLWPMHSEGRAASSSNNDSVVVRLRFGRRVFLFTGDIEKETEATLASGAPEELRCDVLKVAHHGSNTSSTEAFVKAARPAYAVIPVGLASIYGHPHKSTLERLKAGGAQILTTGRSGTITISTDGDDLKVEEFVNSDK